MAAGADEPRALGDDPEGPVVPDVRRARRATTRTPGAACGAASSRWPSSSRSSSRCCSRCPACTASPTRWRTCTWAGCWWRSCWRSSPASATSSPSCRCSTARPVRFGARVALSELAFGAAVSLGRRGQHRRRRVAARRPRRQSGAGRRALGGALPAHQRHQRDHARPGGPRHCGLGVLPGPSNPLLSLVPAAVGAAVLVLFLALPAISDRFAAKRAPGRMRTLLTEFALSIRATRAAAVHRRTGGSSGRSRFCGATSGCWRRASPPPGPSRRWRRSSSPTRSATCPTSIPVPGNIGVLDGSLVGMFVLYGVSATLATAATVVYHAIALWIPAMWGTIAFLILRRTRHEPITLRPPREVRRQRRLERRQHAGGLSRATAGVTPGGRTRPPAWPIRPLPLTGRRARPYGCRGSGTPRAPLSPIPYHGRVTNAGFRRSAYSRFDAVPTTGGRAPWPRATSGRCACPSSLPPEAVPHLLALRAALGRYRTTARPGRAVRRVSRRRVR